MANAVDKEQIEMLSHWWKSYGKGIFFAIIIGLIIGFGWRYWYHKKANYKAEASMVYQGVLNATAAKQPKSASSLLTTLKKKYGDTPYASLGALLVAGNDANANQLDQALVQYKWVTSHSKVSSFKQIARIDAARILLAQKQYDKALAELTSVSDKTYLPLVNSIKGQIYLAQGDKAQAKKAFSSAKAGFQTSGIENPFIGMRLASVG